MLNRVIILKEPSITEGVLGSDEIESFEDHVTRGTKIDRPGTETLSTGLVREIFTTTFDIYQFPGIEAETWRVHCEGVDYKINSITGNPKNRKKIILTCETI